MLRDSLSYATRSLTKRRLRSWLTIIGIFIGIAAVVALISLGAGLREAILTQFSAIGADTITVQPKGGGFGPPGLGSAVKLTEDDLDVVKKSAHVREAAGRLVLPINVEFNNKASIAFTASLPEDEEERALVENFLTPKIESGRWLETDDTGKVVLGHSVAHNEEFGEDIVVGRRIKIEGTFFDVVGIIEKEGFIQLDGGIVINTEDARQVLGLDDEFSLIVAQADSFDNVEFAVEAIEKDLRRSRDVDERKEDFSVSTSQDILSRVDTILGVVTGVLAGIAGISILVGGVGIMNTMYTAVLERKREIGIMKAVGATNAQILMIFLIESGMLGLIGGIIGVLIGWGLSAVVELGAAAALGPNVLQALTPWWLIAGSLAFGFLIGTISGTFPAKRAAQLPPVEALR